MTPGTYIAKPKIDNYVSALLNGFHTVWPESTMVYDGSWCRFYKDNKEVFESNPVYAEYWFLLKKINNEADGKVNKKTKQGRTSSC